MRNMKGTSSKKEKSVIIAKKCDNSKKSVKTEIQDRKHGTGSGTGYRRGLQQTIALTRNDIEPRLLCSMRRCAGKFQEVHAVIMYFNKHLASSIQAIF